MSGLASIKNHEHEKTTLMIINGLPYKRACTRHISAPPATNGLPHSGDCLRTKAGPEPELSPVPPLPDPLPLVGLKGLSPNRQAASHRQSHARPAA